MADKKKKRERLYSPLNKTQQVRYGREFKRAERAARED
ncbi:YfhE family protein [Bacillus changyiensis]|nr:YfhE family protein [Bacillus changyiensis]MDA1478329.1 YfhE family protein [Bacillus changyiensis]